MCICDCILTCIYDYTFELGMYEYSFTHLFTIMLAIHSDGVFPLSCIVCNYADTILYYTSFKINQSSSTPILLGCRLGVHSSYLSVSIWSYMY